MLQYLQAAYKNYVHALLAQKLLARQTPALQDIGDGQHLSGHTIIVTGPTSGIGWETAAELARRGAHVVLACRTQSKGDGMVQALTAEAKQAGRPAPSLEVSLLDLASLESVRAFVQRWEQQRRPLHCLICNAGMFNMGAGRAESKDGLEVHMQTNHLSHFLLTLGLLPALQRGVQQPPQPSTAAGRQDAPAGDTAPFRPRIVSVASAMHHFGYKFGPEDPMQKQAYSTTLAYGNSKLAQVLFTAELNRRLAAAGVPVDALCLHPGNVMTEVVRSLPPLIQKLYRALLTNILFTPQEGARATLFAATDSHAPQLAASTWHYLDAHAEPAQPSSRAGDAQLASWLWEWSKGQVQLPADWDVAAA